MMTNQILRSPDWGGRLELVIDRKAKIRFRVSRKQELSILVLLSYMGLNIREKSGKTNKAFILIPPGGEKQNPKEYKKLTIGSISASFSPFPVIGTLLSSCSSLDDSDGLHHSFSTKIEKDLTLARVIPITSRDPLSTRSISFDYQDEDDYSPRKRSTRAVRVDSIAN
ncbi:hypothetical protein Ccrd_010823, partial [Cynara cardunculus var. scolymus]